MSQIKNKFLGNNEVSSAKIRLENNAALRARNAANSADIELIKLNASDEVVITNLIAPSVDSDAATKLYVDDQIIALDTTIQGELNDILVDIADLVTLSGVAANSTTLGTFTGNIIPDGSTVKQALQALETDLDSIPDPLYYAGTYDAATNTPALSNADTGVSGALYQVTVAGTQDFGAGPITFAIGDKVVNNGTIWEKWDHTDSVDSVNGQTGVVLLNAADIPYDNSTSGLTATDVQAAIDEVVADALLVSADVVDLVTLSGVASGSTDLGTFTGTIIPDASDIKEALQSLETYIEAVPVGANTTLSNLTSPTAINQNLLPDGSNTRSLGTASSYWSTVRAGNMGATSFSVHADPSGSTPKGEFSASEGITLPDGDSVDATVIRSFDNNEMVILSNTFSPTINGSNIRIETDNRASAYDSGDIRLRTGEVVDGFGGSLFMSTGPASGSGFAGNISLTAGEGFGTAYAGNVNINAGAAETRDGGSINIVAGNTVDGAAGGIRLAAGSPSGIGTSGEIKIEGPEVNLYGYGASAQLGFIAADNSFKVALRAPATMAGDEVFTLPATDGTAGQVLTTDGSGNLSFEDAAVAQASRKEQIQLSGGQITAQSVTLAETPLANTIMLFAGGLCQLEGIDYSLSGSTLSFLGDLATGGAAELVAGDYIVVTYSYTP